MASLLWLVAGCEDDINRPCESVRIGLIEFDEVTVRNDLDGWLAAYAPSNANGHADNINEWVQSLRDDCGLDASLLCFACIETFPPQSEVLVRLDSSGVTVDRTIDILTPDTGPMTFRAIH